MMHDDVLTRRIDNVKRRYCRIIDNDKSVLRIGEKRGKMAYNFRAKLGL